MFLESLQLDSASSPVQIMTTGQFKHPSFGKFTITRQTFREILGNFSGENTVAFDYNHNSARAENPEQGKAAGWVQRLDAEGDALFALPQFTEEARGYISRGEYRYISPEFTTAYQDRTTGKDKGAALLAVALTNRPFLEGMAPVALSLSKEGRKMNYSKYAAELKGLEGRDLILSLENLIAKDIKKETGVRFSEALTRARKADIDLRLAHDARDNPNTYEALIRIADKIFPNESRGDRRALVAPICPKTIRLKVLEGKIKWN